MSERDTKVNETAAAFRAGLPYLNRKLITSDKWIAGLNVGGILFEEITEVPMSAIESFANSKVGQLLAGARIIFPSRA